MQEGAPLPFQLALWWVFVGILISLVLPIAVSTLKRAKPKQLEGSEPTIGQRLSRVWERYGGSRYLAIGAAALLVAGVLLFFTGQTFYQTRDAVLAGFAWESFVNKIYSSKPEAAKYSVLRFQSALGPPKWEVQSHSAEHNAEHNNCRMRGTESDLAATHPTVSV
jgi:hypothetical protein